MGLPVAAESARLFVRIPVTGGAFGTSPTAPGTNWLGTALSSNAVGNGPQKTGLLGTMPPSTVKRRRSAG